MADLDQLQKTIMPFGKFKGKPFDAIPLGYLDWLAGRELQNPLKSKLNAYLAHPTIARELDQQSIGSDEQEGE